MLFGRWLSFVPRPTPYGLTGRKIRGPDIRYSTLAIWHIIRPVTLSPGTRVGAYDIDSLLGAGGMGEVYKARDSRLQRSVAIKILPSTFAADPERLARFEREAQVLASLNHPNIAQIYGVEETGGAIALIMELVDGPTLAEVISRRGAHRSVHVVAQWRVGYRSAGGRAAVG